MPVYEEEDLAQPQAAGAPGAEREGVDMGGEGQGAVEGDAEGVRWGGSDGGGESEDTDSSESGGEGGGKWRRGRRQQQRRPGSGGLNISRDLEAENQAKILSRAGAGNMCWSGGYVWRWAERVQNKNGGKCSAVVGYGSLWGASPLFPLPSLLRPNASISTTLHNISHSLPCSRIQ